ncbi:unnamed protein product [Toxocara canis]|uniref:Peptidase S1 domain-containing protein n=1 Tax=Toxocara canis TaxID=6265 RepID=A0A183U0E2_TOXCA|nr:unnamed protein product [Toxocara canis]
MFDSFIRGYPLPPTNLTVETVTVIGDVKFLESTIFWDAEPDDQRAGFYLRVTAVEEWCERDFPGYYEPNIGPVGFISTKCGSSLFACTFI